MIWTRDTSECTLITKEEFCASWLWWNVEWPIITKSYWSLHISTPLISYIKFNFGLPDRTCWDSGSLWSLDLIVEYSNKPQPLHDWAKDKDIKDELHRLFDLFPFPPLFLTSRCTVYTLFLIMFFIHQTHSDFIREKNMTLRWCWKTSLQVSKCEAMLVWSLYFY